ncbi:MAG: hypothetical protein ACTSUE_14450 [Promethearchaeota archaeon]
MSNVLQRVSESRANNTSSTLMLGSSERFSSYSSSFYSKPKTKKKTPTKMIMLDEDSDDEEEKKGRRAKFRKAVKKNNKKKKKKKKALISKPKSSPSPKTKSDFYPAPVPLKMGLDLYKPEMSPMFLFPKKKRYSPIHWSNSGSNKSPRIRFVDDTKDHTLSPTMLSCIRQFSDANSDPPPSPTPSRNTTNTSLLSTDENENENENDNETADEWDELKEARDWLDLPDLIPRNPSYPILKAPYFGKRIEVEDFLWDTGNSMHVDNNNDTQEWFSDDYFSKLHAEWGTFLKTLQLSIEYLPKTSRGDFTFHIPVMGVFLLCLDRDPDMEEQLEIMNAALGLKEDVFVFVGETCAQSIHSSTMSKRFSKFGKVNLMYKFGICPECQLVDITLRGNTYEMKCSCCTAESTSVETYQHPGFASILEIVAKTV